MTFLNLCRFVWRTRLVKNENPLFRLVIENWVFFQRSDNHGKTWTNFDIKKHYFEHSGEIRKIGPKRRNMCNIAFHFLPFRSFQWANFQGYLQQVHSSRPVKLLFESLCMKLYSSDYVNEEICILKQTSYHCAFAQPYSTRSLLNTVQWYHSYLCTIIEMRLRHSSASSWCLARFGVTKKISLAYHSALWATSTVPNVPMMNELSQDKNTINLIPRSEI